MNFSTNLPMWSRCSDLVEVSETSNDAANFISDRRIDTSSSNVFYDSLDNDNPDGVFIKSVNSIETIMSSPNCLQFIKTQSNDAFSILSNSVNSDDEIDNKIYQHQLIRALEASGRFSLIPSLH